MTNDLDILVKKSNSLPLEMRDYITEIWLEDINSEFAWLNENKYNSPILENLINQALSDFINISL